MHIVMGRFELDEVLNAATMVMNSCMLWNAYKQHPDLNNQKTKLLLCANLLHMPFSVLYHLTLHDMAYYGDVFMIFVLAVSSCMSIVNKLPISGKRKKLHTVGSGLIACKGFIDIFDNTSSGFCRLRHSLYVGLSLIPGMLPLFMYKPLVVGLKINVPLILGGLMYAFKIPDRFFKRKIHVCNSHHLMHVAIGIMTIQTYMFLRDQKIEKVAVETFVIEPTSHPVQLDPEQEECHLLSHET